MVARFAASAEGGVAKNEVLNAASASSTLASWSHLICCHIVLQDAASCTLNEELQTGFDRIV